MLRVEGKLVIKVLVQKNNVLNFRANGYSLFQALKRGQLYLHLRNKDSYSPPPCVFACCK